MTPVITTPRGQVFINGNGKAELKFNTSFGPKWTRIYSEAQKFVDSEVLRLCEKYIPKRTGMLVKSGILGSEIGSGTVKWIAPYAKAQYYSPRKVGSQTGTERGPLWFERMKAVHASKIIIGARLITKRESQP